ncbi:hypothetical protein OB919_07350 [Halobacteria archaeon AArc-curdl1]|uniref:Uncharacterized protein n=1 Tax=Natronosalvus hydrolyticus TaxID=2979988 RepID=A0AAP3E6G0_9EURY|nr:hypothetical protein [Halobacteria archaeon AArc-curdl1]
MNATRSVVCLVILTTLGLLVAPVAVAAAGGSSVATGTDGELSSVTNESTDSPSMGEEISTFMQTNDVKTSSSVDERMFSAAFENASPEEQRALIASKTNDSAATLEELEAEYETLLEQRDELHPAEYNTRLTRLTVQLSALDSSLNVTEQRAEAVGADMSKVRELRANASELTGPEVAERAQQIAGVDPPRGPPGHAGPANNTTPDADAGDNGPPADTGGDNGSPTDIGGQGGNASDEQQDQNDIPADEERGSTEDRPNVDDEDEAKPGETEEPDDDDDQSDDDETDGGDESDETDGT